MRVVTVKSLEFDKRAREMGRRAAKSSSERESVELVTITAEVRGG